jgi:hypothetical protein
MNVIKISLLTALLVVQVDLMGAEPPSVKLDAVNQRTEAKKPSANVTSQLMQRRILSGRARLEEVRKALSIPQVGELVNSLHMLYAMGWHRGVHQLLKAIWRNSAKDHQDYADLAWKQLSAVPSRIALASTLNRLYPAVPEYRAYIRSRAKDEHEYHQAQVAISLGLNHDPADVPYLAKLASGDNVYVVQTAITALALMDEEKARLALLDLKKRFAQDPRARLISEVIQRAYPGSRAGP